jgi:hypothetical protein
MAAECSTLHDGVAMVLTIIAGAAALTSRRSRGRHSHHLLSHPISFVFVRIARLGDRQLGLNPNRTQGGRRRPITAELS